MTRVARITNSTGRTCYCEDCGAQMRPGATHFCCPESAEADAYRRMRRTVNVNDIAELLEIARGVAAMDEALAIAIGERALWLRARAVAGRLEGGREPSQP